MSGKLFIPRKNWGQRADKDTLLDEIANYKAIEDWANNPVAGDSKRYATVVGAAKDSAHHDKVDADFVCSGLNDHTTIMNNQRSGMLLLMEGNYDIRGQLNLTSWMNLRGNGPWTFLNLSAAASQIVLPHDTNMYDLVVEATYNSPVAAPAIVMGANSIISNCTLFGNSANGPKTVIQVPVGASNVVVTNCQMWSWLQGLDIIGEAGFYHNLLLSTVQQGFHIHAGTGELAIIISDCGIFGDYITAYEDGVIEDQASTNNGFSGNALLGCYIAGFLNGISSNGHRLVVDACQVTQARRRGIWVQGGYDVAISNNRLTGNGSEVANTYDQLVVDGGNNGYVHGNIVRQLAGVNRSRYGMAVGAGATGALIVNNDLKGSGQTGAYNDAGAGTIKNLDGSANNWNRLV